MSARRWARRCVLQALYSCELSGTQPGAAITAFKEADTRALARADREWFTRLVRGVAAQQAELDALLESCMDRPLVRTDPVVRVVLRLGLYELRHCPEVPWKVVLNEAVELAREFGGDNAYRFVNAVLDRARLAGDARSAAGP